MHINSTKNLETALFLFAHQDDEFGVFQKIADEKENGSKIVCIYLTSGAPSNGCPLKRNRESISVLKKLGVDDILFVGSDLSIADSTLIHNLNTASIWLEDFFNSIQNFYTIYIPAWEGGHPDHDAIHAITIQISSNIGLLDKIRQFSLYHSHQCPSVFFRVLAPLALNGKIERSRIPIKNRFRFLIYALSYPSQTKSWIGLFPFVFFHYIFWGWQEVQPASKNRIQSRPHIGELYYEKRKFASWLDVTEKINSYISYAKKGNK